MPAKSTTKKKTVSKKTSSSTRKKTVRKPVVKTPIKQDKLSKITLFFNEKFPSFKGHVGIFLALLIIGIFVPPLLAAGVIYFIQRSHHVRPRLFGRYFLVYFFMVGLQMFGMAFFLSENIQSFIPRFPQYFGLSLFFYIFIFVWLWYDHVYTKNQSDYEIKKK